MGDLTKDGGKNPGARECAQTSVRCRSENVSSNSSWQDIDVLESVNKALGPLQEFTDIISGKKYVTVSAIKPILKYLEEKVLVDGDADTSLPMPAASGRGSWFPSLDTTKLPKSTSSVTWQHVLVQVSS